MSIVSHQSNGTKAASSVAVARNVVTDSQSITAASDRTIFAPSLIVHDYNGKKAKIFRTLSQIDEFKSGVVKATVFKNLLSCLDLEIDEDEFAEIESKFGLKYQGKQYIRYEMVLRQMNYDNHSEKWTIENRNDDRDTLSFIGEKTTL